MKNVWTLKLDIKKVVTQPIPTFTFGDTSLLKIEVADNGTPIDLVAAGITRGTLNVRLADGTVIGGNVVVFADRVEYTFGSEVQNAGSVICKLMLYDGDNERISTVEYQIIFDSNWVATDTSHPSQDIATTMLQKIAEFEADVAGFQTDVNGFQVNVDNFNARVTYLEENSSSNHTHANLPTLSKIAYTGTNPTVDLKGIEDAAAAITALQAKDVVDEAAEAALADRVTIAETNIVAGQTTNADQQADINSLKTSRTTDEAAISTLNSEVAQNSTDIATNAAGLISANTAIAGKAPTVHVHVEGDVTGLTADLAGKAPVVHTHAESSVTGLVADLAGKAALAHSHSESDVTGLATDLTNMNTAIAGKSNTGHSHVESDVAGLVTDLSNKSNVGHGHLESDISGLTTDLATINTAIADTNTVIQNMKDAEQEPTGFPNVTDSVVTFNDSTRTLTIAPKAPATSFSVYQVGTKYTFSAGQSIQIPNVDGMYFFYFDNGVINQINAFTPLVLTKYVYVANVYWNAGQAKSIVIGEERHGSSMDGQTHAYLHETQGTKFVSGATLNTLSVDGNGNVNAQAQFGVDLGVIRDEDIKETLLSVASTTGLPVLWLSGSSWRKTTNAGYPVLTTGSGRLAYNQNVAGVWQQTEVPNNDYVLYHIFATNDINTPYMSLMGQNFYTTVTLARQGALTELSTLVSNGMPFQEFVPIATLIYGTATSYGNAVKAKIVSTDTGSAYEDWRNSKAVITAGTANSHNNLSDRSAIASHPATAIVYDNSTSLLVATDVQGAINEIDGRMDTAEGSITILNADVANMFIGDNQRSSKAITDANGILESGFYYSQDTANHPIAHNGYIWHNQSSTSDDFAMQIFEAYDLDGVYSRRKVNGVWQAWVNVSPLPPIVYKFNGFTCTSAMTGNSTIPVGITGYDLTKDSLHLHINGLKMIKGRHYSIAGTTITLLNSFTLTQNDDVLVEIYTNNL